MPVPSHSCRRSLPGRDRQDGSTPRWILHRGESAAERLTECRAGPRENASLDVDGTDQLAEPPQSATEPDAAGDACEPSDDDGGRLAELLSERAREEAADRRGAEKRHS